MMGNSEAEAPPAPVPEPRVSARYVFLLNRLRTRQITMEEATELFAIQQAMLASERASNRRSLAGPSTVPAPAPQPGGNTFLGDEDRLWEALLLLGPAAGLFAAILKRSKEAAGTPAGRDGAATPLRRPPEEP